MLTRRTVRLLTGCVVALLLFAAAGDARKVKIYRYQNPDGTITEGFEPPPEATNLQEIGFIEVPASQLAAPGGIRERVMLRYEQLGSALQAEPLAVAIAVALVYLLAIVALRLLPPIFKTMELDLRRAQLLVLASLAAFALLWLIGLGLDALWSAIGWSMRDDLGHTTYDAIGWVLRFAVVYYLFLTRVAVGVVQAFWLALLWVSLVVAFAAAVWIFAMPQLELLFR